MIARSRFQLFQRTMPLVCECTPLFFVVPCWSRSLRVLPGTGEVYKRINLRFRKQTGGCSLESAGMWLVLFSAVAFPTLGSFGGRM